MTPGHMSQNKFNKFCTKYKLKYSLSNFVSVNAVLKGKFIIFNEKRRKF